jgi:FkbM family methyltransferase
MPSENTLFFDPSLNGLGDCIVGCSSAFILSQVLNMEFRVLPGSIGLYSYFDIPESYRGNLSSTCREIKYGGTQKEQEFWLTNNLKALFGTDLVVLSCMNFGRFIYRNNQVSSCVTVTETNVINYLFDHILKVKEAHLLRFNSLQDQLNMKDQICVHLRCDDVWGDSNSGETRFAVDSTIRRFVKCVKQCDMNCKSVILISDHVDRVIPIFEENDIKCNLIPGGVKHSSKYSDIDHEKTILDILTIGSCKTSIISYWSNFSRIGVLRTLISPWIVQPETKRNNSCAWDFNVDVDQGVEFRRARPDELLSKERALIELPTVAENIKSMKPFLESSGIQFDGNYIRLREGTKRINLDIGSSYYAPHSQVWLEKDPDLFVFAFEPIPESAEELKRGPVLRFDNLPKAIESKYLSRLSVIPCALGPENGVEKKFYMTTNHADCSSLLRPALFDYIERSVQMWRLDAFLKHLNFPYIDYVKIDAQGFDFEIIKSAGIEASRRIVYVTLENELGQYHGINHSQEDVDKYMESIGFEKVTNMDTKDPTYVNIALRDKRDGCIVYQKT